MSFAWRRVTGGRIRRSLVALVVVGIVTGLGFAPPVSADRREAGHAGQAGQAGHGDRGGRRVDNPYAGATGYVDPEYAANVRASARQEGGRVGSRIRRLDSVPTAVWLDRIAAVTGGPGVTMTLRDHLEAALRQQRRSRHPVAVTLVLYDLPNRDCAALASAGELRVAENGEERYRTEFVDPVADLLRSRRYAGLRKVVVVEPDSLPNLVTNLAEPRCAEAAESGAYVEGVQYALDRLRPLPNTYLYVDIAHSGWLGWDPNFGDAVQLIGDTIRGTEAGVASVDGFVTNTSNYVPTEEVFLPDPERPFGDVPLRSNSFHQWNPYFDELDYAQAMRRAFVDSGFPDSIGMLIDTGRNGWGGPSRPTAASTSSDLETFVAESRLDRRPIRSDWCNQVGAGIGARPAAHPEEGIDAFVWVKPPGESDGVSEPGVPDPDDPNKTLDPMCDPDAPNRFDPSFPTNALDGAPHAGRWFHEQLVMLVENAHPRL
jgi:cellulose 1,4-beta-cellobiosidase